MAGGLGSLVDEGKPVIWEIKDALTLRVAELS